MNPRMLTLSVILTMSTVLVAAQQAKKPKITMEQARATALAKAPGKVKSAELEKEHGKLLYSFDIETTAGIREVQVDAYSGAIISDQVESAADEASEAAEEKKKASQTKTRHSTPAPTPK